MSSEPRSVVLHRSWCGVLQGHSCDCDQVGDITLAGDTSLTDPTYGLRSERLSRGTLFMRVAHLYGQRSSCPRADVGVVAVREGRIVAAGYCGAPSGLEHCTEVGCDIGTDGGCERSVHAEANMIAWAARTGTALEACEVYCTMSPCYNCAKLLANAGIINLAYAQKYRNIDGLELLDQLGVKTHYAPQSTS